MRAMVYFTLGFAVCCGLGAYSLGLPTWAIPALLAGAVVAAVPAVVGHKRRLGKIALCLTGAAVGAAWFVLYQGAYLSTPIALDGQTVSLTFRASDYGEEGLYGPAAEGLVRLDGKPYQLRCYLHEDISVSPGDQITGPFRLEVTTPGGEGESPYYQGKGIFLLAFQEDAVTVVPGDKSWRDVPAQMRLKIKEVIDRCLPAHASPFARALMLGDTSLLDYETDTALKLSGIRHVAAVSGLHVSILFALLSAASLGKPWMKAALGLPALALFAALAGFSPSVTRACVMAGLMLLSALLKKEYDGPTALAFASLVMLLANPLTITSVSFQLSVCSVAGIFLFGGRIGRWLKKALGGGSAKGFRGKLARWVSGSVGVSVGSCILTTPLGAWYFGTVSLVGILTNLLTLWAISLIFYGVMLSCLAYLALPTLGILLGRAVGALVGYVLFVARLLSRFPLAAVYTCSGYITAWLGLCYILLAVFMLSRKKRPVILACCIGLGLWVSVLASWAEPWMSGVRATVLDVGQGQSVLLQCGGASYLVDCGGDRDSSAADTAAQMLLSQGITRLDGLILTHYDRDHAGGVQMLLSRIDTEVLVLPPTPPERPMGPAGTVVYGTEPLAFEGGGGRLLVIPPVFSEKGNDLGLSVLFDTENCDILITGDRSGAGERRLLASYPLPKADVLIAGHHGAANATSRELLEAVSPEIVCISVGADNAYGHPAEQTLQRLRDFGCTVYRTDRGGTITIRR